MYVAEVTVHPSLGTFPSRKILLEIPSDVSSQEFYHTLMDGCRQQSPCKDAFCEVETLTYVSTDERVKLVVPVMPHIRHFHVHPVDDIHHLSARPAEAA